jgi:hypothetical protein
LLLHFRAVALQITQVDAFTDAAREMNLSETAFLVRQADGFDLRWRMDVTVLRGDLLETASR